MSKKIILIIMCNFIFMFTGITVSADSFGGSEGASGEGTVGNCFNGWCWLAISEKSLEGIRISFYHKNGNKVGNSLNFYNSVKIKSEYKEFNYYTPGINGSKYDYIDSNISLVNYSQWPSSGFDQIFKGGIPFRKDLYNTGNAANVFKEKLGLSNPNDITTKIINEGFEDSFNLGISLQTIINSEDYYMLVEPITALIKGGTKYLGTYYELQQIYNYEITNKGTFGHAKSLFYSSGAWGDAHFAMALYLKSESTIGGSGKMKDFLDTIKEERSFTAEDNGYGIGVVWFGDFENDCNENSELWNPVTQSCEATPPSEDIETCEVLDPVVDPCNNRIVYEYRNCSTSGYSKVEYSGYTICDIQCNEKYYIATLPTVHAFNPISGTGILAGSYFEGIGPTVYHKKTCNYVIDETKLRNVVDYKIGTTCKRTDSEEVACPNPSSTETCYTTREYIDSNCSAEITAQAYEGSNSVKGRCDILKINYDNMDSERDATSDATSQQKLPLDTTFSDYEMSSTVIETEYNLDGFQYGYKNTFNYALSGTINRYIGMNSIYSINDTTQEQYYDFGRPMLTTPILVTSGSYNYTIDYPKVFSNEFKDVIKTYSNNRYNIDRDLNVTSCPYNVIEKNIITHCIPTRSNHYCGDPDFSFQIPNIKMVYRPISLNNPFPGKDGTGRDAGLNWNIGTIDLYIYGNRGVQSDKIYTEKEALYVIKLDANNIKDIREYNKIHDYDDFTLTCTEGTGTECISNFLRNYNLLTGGTCANVTSGDGFYSCADK